MLVKQFLTGGDRNFGYVAVDESSKEAFIVDPSYSPKSLVEFANKAEYKIKYIFCTHSHSDHTNGNTEIELLTGIKVLMFGDIEPNTAEAFTDGAILKLGRIDIKILHTPGHTQDSICIFAGDAVFTGDTLFVGKVGGTDLVEQAKSEYYSFHNKLLKLPDETRVFPGHNYGTAPESTIGKEKKENPFLIQPTLEAFIDLKKNWATYKKEHNIS